jgi:hypothetical protein
VEPEDEVLATDAPLVPTEETGKLTDDQILETLEQNQLSKVKRLAGAHTEAAIKALAQICKNKKIAPAPRVSAARALLDYAHGKPSSQQVAQPQGPGGDRVKVIILKLSDGSTEELGLETIDVTPGAPPVHEQAAKPHSSVAGVAVLELGK